MDNHIHLMPQCSSNAHQLVSPSTQYCSYFPPNFKKPHFPFNISLKIRRNQTIKKLQPISIHCNQNTSYKEPRNTLVPHPFPYENQSCKNIRSRSHALPKFLLNLRKTNYAHKTNTVIRTTDSPIKYRPNEKAFIITSLYNTPTQSGNISQVNEPLRQLNSANHANRSHKKITLAQTSAIYKHLTGNASTPKTQNNNQYFDVAELKPW